MTASEKGHVEVVKSLIEAGANISHTNKVGIHHSYFTLLDAHCPLPYSTHLQLTVNPFNPNYHMVPPACLITWLCR